MSKQVDDEDDSCYTQLNTEIPNTHCFIYENQEHPFNFDYFKYASQYFAKSVQKIQESKYIQFDNEYTEGGTIFPEETLNSFVDYFHHKPVALNNENITILDYFAHKFNINALVEASEKYMNKQLRYHEFQSLMSHLQNQIKYQGTAELKEVNDNHYRFQSPFILKKHLDKTVIDEMQQKMPISIHNQIDQKAQFLKFIQIDQREQLIVFNQLPPTTQIYIFKQVDKDTQLFLFKQLKDPQKVLILNEVHSKIKYFLFIQIEQENQFAIFKEIELQSQLYIFHQLEPETQFLLFNQFDQNKKLSFFIQIKDRFKLFIFKKLDQKIQAFIFKQLKMNTQIFIMHFLEPDLQIFLYNKLDVNQQHSIFKEHELDKDRKLFLFNAANSKGQLFIFNSLEKSSQLEIFNNADGKSQLLVSNDVKFAVNSETKNKITSLLKFLSKQVKKYGKNKNDTFPYLNIDKISRNEVKKTKSFKTNEFFLYQNVYIPHKMTNFLCENGLLNSSEMKSQIANFSDFYFEIQHPSENFDIILKEYVKLKATQGIQLKLSVLITGIEETDLKLYQNTFVNHIKIDSGVTTIKNINGRGSFSGCTSLHCVEIPYSVTTIESYAFSECSALPDIFIPSSIISIGEGAFSKCSSLFKFCIPSSVTYLGPNVLSGCTSLEHLVIPESLFSKEIGIGPKVKVKKTTPGTYVHFL